MAVISSTPVEPIWAVPRTSTFALNHATQRFVMALANKGALRAMAEDPEDRYDSVEALAQDLRRYRTGRPVLAVTPSSWYLLRKLIARNRAVSTLSVALVLSLGADAAVDVVRLADAAADVQGDEQAMGVEDG